MMFAARKLQGIGLIMLLTICALIVYPISLRVSATRAELQRVEREIAETKQQNRMLEGDIAVLANLHQLDRWNSEFFAYTAPTSSQYLSGERDLASLNSLRPPRGGMPQQPVLAALRADTLSVDGADGSDSQRRLALLDRQGVANRAAREIRSAMIAPGGAAAIPTVSAQ
ncbi:MAG: hypothetical protein ABL909_02465 [Sphingopyxis sp.]